MAAVSTLDRYRGCLIGGAAGDALGAPVEFLSHQEIRARFGPDGIQDPAEAYGRVGAITDDTQMTLFTAEGLLQADRRLERGIGNPPFMLWFAYQRWLVTQGVENPMPPNLEWRGGGELRKARELYSRRAPGNTCLSALMGEWHDRIAPNNSKGCGGVMRAAPCGLVSWAPDGPYEIGWRGASVTHGHPTGYLTAGALAVIVERLVKGEGLSAAVDAGVAAVREHPDSEETVHALERAREHEGPIDALGAGWVAEEALAIAVHAALTHPGDFAAGVRLAVNHSGDSDSTGAIAGNLLGAHLGVQAVPPSWLEVLELRDTIDRLARAMHQRFVERLDDVDWEVF